MLYSAAIYMQVVNMSITQRNSSPKKIQPKSTHPEVGENSDHVCVIIKGMSVTDYIKMLNFILRG